MRGRGTSQRVVHTGLARRVTQLNMFFEVKHGSNMENEPGEQRHEALA